ncbi:MAG: 50S ribosomal protein L4 [Candidatus Vogelbacteria bacterium]|nr:50S ribosomal protein L4 [Candidatus Vogelbacteria bacterium]
MEAPIYNQNGQSAGTMELPKGVFGMKWNGDLVHQVITGLAANARQTLADTKGRGAVRGGGKKPWQQKGTGRARHGSIRSPIWVGGGVTHGPVKEKNYTQKINKKMKAKALAVLLSAKLADREVLLLDTTPVTPKTKEAITFLKQLSGGAKLPHLLYLKGHRALIVVPNEAKTLRQGFRNISTVRVEAADTISPTDVAKYQYVVITDPKLSVPVLERRTKVSNK